MSLFLMTKEENSKPSSPCANACSHNPILIVSVSSLHTMLAASPLCVKTRSIYISCVKRDNMLIWHAVTKRGLRFESLSTVADGKSEHSSLAGNNGIVLFSTGVLSARVSEWEHQWPVEGLLVSHHLCCSFVFVYFVLQKSSAFSRLKQRLSHCTAHSLEWHAGVLLLQTRTKECHIGARLSVFDCDTQSLSFSSLAWLGHVPTGGYFPIVHYTSSICYSIIALRVMNIFEALMQN